MTDLALAILRGTLEDSRKRADLLLRAEHDTVCRLAESLEACSNDEPEISALRSEANWLKDRLTAASNALIQRMPDQREPEPIAAPPSTALEFLTPPPLPPISAVDSKNGTDLQDEIIQLRRRFKALSKNFKTARGVLGKRKDERDKWIKHATQLESLIATAEAHHGIQILHRANPSSDVGAAPAKNDEAAHGEANPKSASVVKVSHKQPEPLTPLDVSPSNHEQRVTPDVINESTQGDDEDSGESPPPLPEQDNLDQTRIKQEPSSDTPVVISERQLHKRKRGDNISQSLVVPKLEDDSSPVLCGSRDGVQIQDSLDLGEIAQKMDTPRKRKSHDQGLFDTGIATALPELSFTTPAISARQHQPPQSVTGPQKSSALTPLSVNARAVRSGGDQARDQARKKHQLSYAIGKLADDGSFYGFADSSQAQVQGLDSATPVSKGRLHSLLNSKASSASTDANTTSRIGPKTREPLATGLPIPERRELPFDKYASSAVGVGSPFAQNVPLQRPELPSAKRPARETSPQRKKPALAPSLRDRPVSELGLDDFKINPLANDGHGFAFAEVVRDKSDRACLPGCTDMHCCGKHFRALALSQRPNAPLTPSQRLEEQRLLEKHLGDRAHLLATMSREERAELWVEAKTQELADKYGKHRHRFPRMQSPPGFWNADFPSTQELQADRAEAAKRERQAVTERYREAMRPGGRWVFKDK